MYSHIVVVSRFAKQQENRPNWLTRIPSYRRPKRQTDNGDDHDAHYAVAMAPTNATGLEFERIQVPRGWRRWLKSEILGGNGDQDRGARGTPCIGDLILSRHSRDNKDIAKLATTIPSH